MKVLHTDLAVIGSLDLEKIKAKLMHKEAGKGWSRARAEAAEHEYRRFLYLAKTYPNELTAPSVEVDTFWHQHILDTLKYARDCQTVFGYFLHHDPNLGLTEDSGDDALRHRAGKRMRELYKEVFGEAAPGVEVTLATSAAWCTVAQPAPSGASAETAWCTVTHDGPARASRVAATATAWCMRADQKHARQAADPAWCMIDTPARADSAETGKCAIAPTARSDAAATAWCTAPCEPDESQTTAVH